MAGTKAGGIKAAKKNLARDPQFYAKIGAKGGKNGKTGGFAANPELARIAGAKGGRISRRRKATVATAQGEQVYRLNQNTLGFTEGILIRLTDIASVGSVWPR